MPCSIPGLTCGNVRVRPLNRCVQAAAMVAAPGFYFAVMGGRKPHLAPPSNAAVQSRAAMDPASSRCSPDGDDRWSGTLATPLADRSDGPFATLERARDAIRLLNRGPRTDAGAVVFLRGGTYWRIADAFAWMRNVMAAAADRPVVVLQGHRDERKSRLVGGRVVTNFVPVTDPLSSRASRSRRRAASCFKPIYARRASSTPRRFFNTRGFHRPIQPAPLELFFRGSAMPLAALMLQVGICRNRASVSAGPDGGRFAYDNEPLLPAVGQCARMRGSMGIGGGSGRIRTRKCERSTRKSERSSPSRRTEFTATCLAGVSSS